MPNQPWCAYSRLAAEKRSTQGVDSAELLHELRPTREQKTAKVMGLVTEAENVHDRDSVFPLELYGSLDGTKLGHDDRIFNRDHTAR